MEVLFKSHSMHIVSFWEIGAIKCFTDIILRQIFLIIPLEHILART